MLSLILEYLVGFLFGIWTGHKLKEYNILIGGVLIFVGYFWAHYLFWVLLGISVSFSFYAFRYQKIAITIYWAIALLVGALGHLIEVEASWWWGWLNTFGFFPVVVFTAYLGWKIDKMLFLASWFWFTWWMFGVTVWSDLGAFFGFGLTFGLIGGILIGMMILLGEVRSVISNRI